MEFIIETITPIYIVAVVKDRALLCYTDEM